MIAIMLATLNDNFTYGPGTSYRLRCDVWASAMRQADNRDRVHARIADMRAENARILALLY